MKANNQNQGEVMKNFRTLDLAIEFHPTVNKIELNGHLKDQLFRAATSIPLNLSEGNARPTSKDKKRYYQIAYSSLKECQTIFKLITVQHSEVEQMADHLGALL